MIDRAWVESSRTCTYLGEWHTHPEPIPSASFIDQGSWCRKLLVDRYAGCLFFVIVGTSEVKVWEGQRGRKPASLMPVLEGVQGDE